MFTSAKGITITQQEESVSKLLSSFRTLKGGFSETTSSFLLTEQPIFDVVENELLQRFQRLVRTWKDETEIISSARELALHPAYQQIIGMGEVAVSLILQELQSTPGHWFWALKAITGKDPVPEGERGNISRMTERWLEWGKENGYL